MKGQASAGEPGTEEVQMAPPLLTVSPNETAEWFQSLQADHAVIEAMGFPLPFVKPDAAALEVALAKLRFPAAMVAKFPSLSLYSGETGGVGEGGRSGGAAEWWAVICAMAVMTSVMHCYLASEAGDEAAANAATKMLTVYQKRGPTLFSVTNPVRPVSVADCIRWGKSCVEHAPTPEKMGASYLTLVLLMAMLHLSSIYIYDTQICQCRTGCPRRPENHHHQAMSGSPAPRFE
eukprot:SAG31_NODE_2197_length_6216_cov_4.189962_3_plen_234_part_00